MQIEKTRIFPYAKASQEEAEGEAINLSIADSPILRPAIGRLITALVHDQGRHFEYLQERHLEGLSLSRDELFNLAMENLDRFVEEGNVQLHKAGLGYALIAGGHFESTLLLCEGIWQGVSTSIGATSLVAAAPARDLLFIADANIPEAVQAVRDFTQRAMNDQPDHPLPPDLYFWNGNTWEASALC